MSMPDEKEARAARVAELGSLCRSLVEQARAAGCRGVILALSRDEPGGAHSEFYVSHHGPCLELEGLTSRIRAVMDGLWEGRIVKQPTEPPR